jgi:RimJ/RimL family protein N-acetyltransferase
VSGDYRFSHEGEAAGRVRCIATRRLNLVPLHERHRTAFAEMHTDPEVMADLGGPISQAESEGKFDRYCAAYVERGFSRWVVESKDGEFLGYAGVLARPSTEHPLGPHCEIGWRLMRKAWGRGFATESAKAALEDAFRHTDLDEILSYTAPENSRSQAVMVRLGLRRDPARDFTAEFPRVGAWRGMVWAASRACHVRCRTESPSSLPRAVC